LTAVSDRGRYPIGFSGDTYMEWSSLAWQPQFTATAANVLFYWSHYIGGHRSQICPGPSAVGPCYVNPATGEGYGHDKAACVVLVMGGGGGAGGAG
jgi:hypothetical protein